MSIHHNSAGLFALAAMIAVTMQLSAPAAFADEKKSRKSRQQVVVSTTDGAAEIVDCSIQSHPDCQAHYFFTVEIDQ